MANAGVILKFEIVEGRSPEAVNAAEALSAWVDLLCAAAAIVEPGEIVRIDLVGVQSGSQVFEFAIRKIEQFLVDTREGMKEFPEISNVLISLGGLIVTTAAGVGLTTFLTPEPRLPDDQMAVFEGMRDNLKESVELQKQQARFYGILQDEPAYDRIDVINGANNEVVYSVPRIEFATRSGVWAEEPQLEAITAKRTAVWDVVLIKPVLIPEPRRWRFAREGLEFSALMQDASVLQAIHDKTLPMQIAEGVMMKVEMNYRESFDGKVWIPVAGSHKIKRVLYPLPPSAPGPLFAPDTP